MPDDWVVWTGRQPRRPEIALRATRPDGCAFYAIRTDALSPSAREAAEPLSRREAVSRVMRLADLDPDLIAAAATGVAGSHRCDECGAGFETSAALTYHSRVHA